MEVGTVATRSELGSVSHFPTDHFIQVEGDEFVKRRCSAVGLALERLQDCLEILCTMGVEQDHPKLTFSAPPKNEACGGSILRTLSIEVVFDVGPTPFSMAKMNPGPATGGMRDLELCGQSVKSRCLHSAA